MHTVWSEAAGIAVTHYAHADAFVHFHGCGVTKYSHANADTSDQPKLHEGPHNEEV